MKCKWMISLLCVAATFIAAPSWAQEEAELAKKLQNPVASLLSVEGQANWDFGIGSNDAKRYTFNLQPVIPLSISKEWNLITRTIMPIIYAEAPVAGGNDESGLGDIVQRFFLSPKEPTRGGWIWGAGPVLLYPSATNGELGSGKWGAGPTAVLLRQDNGWTFGMLGNHVWSYAGWGNRDVNETFLQPFVSYTTKAATTFGLNTESTYDWEADQWTVPLNLTVSQVVMLDKQPVNFAFGGRYYAEKATGGPDWGLRFVVTFMFPK